jgi:hypothetical protein
MIEAISAKLNVILKFSKTYPHRLERKFMSDGEWLVFTDSGWLKDDYDITPVAVQPDVFLDSTVTDGVYQYRERKFDDPDAKYEISLWVRCGNTGPVGYTFENYHAPEGEWGTILTADDMRYTYCWGVDMRATNGMSYTDGQIRFHIESSLEEMERRLNITIKKKRIACEPQRRGLQHGIDYDEEEAYYTFRRERIQRNGMITTRKRPVLSMTRLDLLSRTDKIFSYLNNSTIDKTKGIIRFFNRPIGPSDSTRAVQSATLPYGPDTYSSQLFYAIDYVAGFESSDAVPKDLRAAIGKMCAIELLNIIGDGLLAGFSSSSLSMDGVSESFSSTQSATSATYGARIKEYGDELNGYIKANKLKFGNIPLGSL